MASPNTDSSWLFLNCESYGSFNRRVEEADPANSFSGQDASTSFIAGSSSFIPRPPPLPCRFYKRRKTSSCPAEYSLVPKETSDVWDKVFRDGYGADVYVVTEDTSCVLAHSNVLSVASPVLNNILQESKVKHGRRYIKIPGVPSEAVYTFVRFLYSSCYKGEALKKFVLHLLVLSHCYLVPSLKRLCVYLLEQDWLTRENVIDVLQLARQCDAPRLSFLCIRMVVKDFKSISSSEGGRVMRCASPALEQELVELVVEADSRKQERLQKMEERKVYLQLHEALEALLHICRDGCRTIGPCDKMLKGSEVICNFQACKGVESSVRHFSNCKMRVPGGCVHCKRMWQLLELHSRMCDEPDSCNVPLCRYLKDKIQQHGKKDEAKWKLLVSKVVAARNALGPFSAKRASFI